jgi:hypothetical protein
MMTILMIVMMVAARMLVMTVMMLVVFRMLSMVIKWKTTFIMFVFRVLVGVKGFQRKF